MWKKYQNFIPKGINDLIDNVSQVAKGDIGAIGKILDSGPRSAAIGSVIGSSPTFKGGGDVDSIKAAITAHTGLARTNRFNVGFNTPAGMNHNDITPDHNMLCESCSIPGKQLQTAEYAIWRRTELRPYTYALDEVSFTFHLTNDYYFKNLFDAWLNFILDPVTYKLRYKGEYAVPFTIQQLDHNNRMIHEVKLIEAFPINISSIELNNTSNDATQRVTVALAYKDILTT